MKIKIEATPAVEARAAMPAKVIAEYWHAPRVTGRKRKYAVHVYRDKVVHLVYNEVRRNWIPSNQPVPVEVLRKVLKAYKKLQAKA